MRVVALSSNYKYGSTEIDDEHILDKLNSYLETYADEKTTELAERQRNIPYPVLDSENPVNTSTDVAFYGLDSHRNYHSMQERFHKGQVSLESLMRLSDPPTRIHMSAARGVEKTLIRHFNHLDAEMLNYKSIRL